MNPARAAHKIRIRVEDIKVLTTSAGRFLALVGLALVVSQTAMISVARADCAAMFKQRTVTWVVPNAPGGGYDIYSRLIAPYYEKYLGAEVVVVNEAGAGGRIGANRIRRSTPDGTVVGIINGSGLMAAAYSGIADTPNPAQDFAILGRVTRNLPVWLTGNSSGINSVHDLIELSRQRPVVGATNSVGSTSFLNLVIGADLLELPMEIVVGFKNSSDGIAALLRNEVDVVAHSLGSVQAGIKSGELVPLFKVSDGSHGADHLLDGVTVLFGGAGVIDARFPGDTARQARAAALANLMGAGRLLVAPPGVAEETLACMRQAMGQALNDQGFRDEAARMNRPLDVSDAETATRDLQSAKSQAIAFAPLIKAAAGKIQQ